MRKILGYIAEKYDQDITLEELAKVGFISVTKCLKLFKEYTSLSPIAYLIKYRLNIVYELIKESDDTTMIQLLKLLARSVFLLKAISRECL